MTRRYEEPSDPSGRAQAVASRDWIYSRMDRNRTRGSNPYRIRYSILGLSNEPAFALGGVRPCGLRNRLGSVLHPYGASIIRQTESAHAKLRDCAN